MKEAEHVEGFAPEVAWVTQGGSEKLAGAPGRAPHERDDLLRDVLQVGAVLARPAHEV